MIPDNGGHTRQEGFCWAAPMVQLLDPIIHPRLTTEGRRGRRPPTGFWTTLRRSSLAARPIAQSDRATAGEGRGTMRDKATAAERVVFGVVALPRPDHLTRSELVLKAGPDGR